MLTEHGCKIAPNTYWTARKRPPSRRAIRDAELKIEIQRVYDENLFVPGSNRSGETYPSFVRMPACESGINSYTSLGANVHLVMTVTGTK